jgi:hypothetical protein
MGQYSRRGLAAQQALGLGHHQRGGGRALEAAQSRAMAYEARSALAVRLGQQR